MNTCVKIEGLMQIKDVTEEDAKLIRKVWLAKDWEALAKVYPDSSKVHTDRVRVAGIREVKRACIDEILNTYGVECLGQLKRSGTYLYYCNAGDTYANTVIFIGMRLITGCWGYYIERGKIKEFVQP